MKSPLKKAKEKCIKCGVFLKTPNTKSRYCKYCVSRYLLVRKRIGNFKPCEYCGKNVWIMPCRGNLYKTTFCSKEHLHKYQKENAFNFPCFICEKKIFTQPTQLKYRARSTCSIKCRSKLSRKRANERRVSLGYTKHQLDRLARYSPEAEKWRKDVFERDNYTCQICGIRGTYLEADHLKPWAYFPELRFEISNGRTLCRPCHDTTKISAKRMREIYGQAQEKN